MTHRILIHSLDTNKIKSNFFLVLLLSYVCWKENEINILSAYENSKSHKNKLKLLAIHKKCFFASFLLARKD